MDITEVRIKLMADPHERLQAFCSVTFDHCFVIRDLKIIEGTKGSFVAMPSRKLTDRCPQCGCKNHLRSSYCNQCGVRLSEDRAGKDVDGRSRLYADIAHPINSKCRDAIQKAVIAAFHEEQIRAKEPGYICRYDDFGEEDYADLMDDLPMARPAAVPAPRVESQPVAERESRTVAESQPEMETRTVAESRPAAERETQVIGTSGSIHRIDSPEPFPAPSQPAPSGVTSGSRNGTVSSHTGSDDFGSGIL
jgi:stage V sporulation protein G